MATSEIKEMHFPTLLNLEWLLCCLHANIYKALFPTPPPGYIQEVAIIAGDAPARHSAANSSRCSSPPAADRFDFNANTYQCRCC